MIKFIFGKLESIVSKQTLKNISTLMGGTFIAAIIPILSAPIMSRLYEPKFYGVLGLYMSVTGLVGILAYNNYAQAIMMAKEDEDSKQIVWFSLLISFVISCLSGLMILLISGLTNFIHDSEAGNWYFFVPLTIFFNGINYILLIWANRIKHYRILAFNRVIQAIVTVTIQIVLGLLIKNETGLMTGLLFGQFFSAFLLVMEFYFKHKIFHIGEPDFSKFREIANKYRNLALYSTPSEFINNFINQTPIFFLQKFGGASYVGNFTFTQRFLGLPQQFLSSAIVDVFKQKASEAFNQNGNCRLIFIKTLKALTGLAFLPLLVAIFFAPQIFSFVFGDKWIMAGIFAQFLSILFFFRFIVSPLSYVYFIAGKMKEDLALHLLFFVVTSLAFYFGNTFFSDKKYLVLAYSITYSGVYIIYLIRSYLFSKGKTVSS